MKRRIFATLLAFCLIASLCVVGAAAASVEGCPGGSGCAHEAAIGDVHYDTLADALSAAIDGDTVMLLRDINIDSSYISITKSIVFDLGGNTITCSLETQAVAIYNNSYVTIQNGRIYCSNNAVALFVYLSHVTTRNIELISDGYKGVAIQVGYSKNGDYWGNLTVEDGTVVYGTSAGILVVGPYLDVDSLENRDNRAAIMVNGGTITGGYAISGNGRYQGTTIEINDGIIGDEETYITVYHPQMGDITLNGGTLTGQMGVQMCSGELNVPTYSSVVINAIGEDNRDNKEENDGPVLDGAAVSSLDRNYPGGPAVVNISGGTFNSTQSESVLTYSWNSSSKEHSTWEEETEYTHISGGEFSDSVVKYVSPDLQFEANSNGVYTYHRTIESAVAAAGNDGSVSMISDGAVVDETTGHTITRIDGGSKTTMTVTDGYVYTLPELDKNGYTFVGWRLGNSNTILKPGDTYTVSGDTTFTAVWNMINVPDTYEISVISSDGGTVEASLSNASAGSVITLTVTPDEGYELAYITVDGERISGTSFVMPDHSVEVRAVFTEIGAEMNFVDVNTGDWFYDAVEYVYTNGLMEGTSTRTFEPNATMTRAMFWTVLARIDGETITGDNWKTLAQNWAVSSGISDGTNADALITREQMVTMLYRFANSPEVAATGFGQFTDGASVSDWAVDAMAWALNNGVITGMGDGILSPSGSATRAQAAAMLMRFVEA